MANEEFRVFLSGVTGEFGKARDAVSAALQSRGLYVRVQSNFRLEATSYTTLQKLHDYIWGCDAVVCLVGKHCGALPPAAAAAPFVSMLPEGVEQASYTQWEFFFARHHQRRLSVYMAGNGHVPGRGAPADDDHQLQRDFVHHLVGVEGRDRVYFNNADQLCAGVLQEDWPLRGGNAPNLASRLILIYNDYRDAYLSQKYYGQQLQIATKNRDETQASEFANLYKKYAEFTSVFRLIVNDVTAESGLSDKAWTRYRRMRDRIARLEKQEPHPNRSLLKRCQEEVNHEVPPDSFWMPAGPRPRAIEPVS